jgi:hypothetical protein
LHPAHAGRQERVVVAVLDEAPEAPAVVVVDRAVDERVGELDREGEVVVVTVALSISS